jgi:hypothetical protein
MNPDLAMGDELLKKTGAGNLFMVFGEPDVEIKKQKDGKLTAEIKGVDIYDPTTGQIRNSSTDDIACWFIDTDYNGESFFVRYAYFTGADEPYEKLKRALRADIDEAAWSSLYSTVSRPFDKPKTGKIAIKVINHYGDEVLKVFEVGKQSLRNPETKLQRTMTSCRFRSCVSLPFSQSRIVNQSRFPDECCQCHVGATPSLRYRNQRLWIEEFNVIQPCRRFMLDQLF